MTRESVEVKARRYLAEGRLTVMRVDAELVEAVCRGAGAIYELGYDGDAWSCSCPAVRRCAHLEALALVTVRERPVSEVADPEPHVSRSSGAEAESDEGEPEPTTWL